MPHQSKLLAGYQWKTRALGALTSRSMRFIPATSIRPGGRRSVGLRLRHAWRIACGCFVLTAVLPLTLRAESEAEATLTKVGQPAPSFEFVTLDGQKVELKSLRGKVVLVNFFATWCGPCMMEMPRLEKEVWQKFKDQNVAMVAIGREHTNAELGEFKKQRQLTLPLAGDPNRKIYSLFAKQYIPRNYVISADGKIAFQSVGYTEPEFARMIEVLRLELKKTEAKKTGHGTQ
jgi:peroxiredoxin